jgi:hypothetical protein
MTNIDRLGIELASRYDVDTRTAMEAVDTYAGQLQDDDLYSTDTDRLTEAGAEVIRAQFAADHGAPLPGTVADDKGQLRAEVRDLTQREADLRVGADQALDERDALIRRGIEMGVRVADLAEDAGLKPARIYQIRDRRR